MGWVIGPRALIERLTEAKQWSDLHTDQLSQAVLLRFAESGRLEQHRQRMLKAGRERLQAALERVREAFAGGLDASRVRAGGMNMWVELPEAAGCRRAAAARGARRRHLSAGQVFRGDRVRSRRRLRISFAGHDAGGNPDRAWRYWDGFFGRSWSGRECMRRWSKLRRWCE